MNAVSDRSAPVRRRKRRKLGLDRLIFAIVLFLSCAVVLGTALRLVTTAAANNRPSLGAAPAAVSPSAGPAVSPSARADDWRLTLVGPWNPLPEDREIAVTRLKSGQAVDERCYPELQDMMDDCRAAGLSPVICSSYRTWEKQERLFTAQVNKLLARGYPQDEAEKEAGTAVAVPGTSEHQLGLAVDIVDLSNQRLDESQEKTAVQKWLMKNSWKYGFILRYPNEKSAVTGIIYEPWHYRYVGGDAAREIHQRGICLEEYLEE